MKNLIVGAEWRLIWSMVLVLGVFWLVVCLLSDSHMHVHMIGGMDTEYLRSTLTAVFNIGQL